MPAPTLAGDLAAKRFVILMRTPTTFKERPSVIGAYAKHFGFDRASDGQRRGRSSTSSSSYPNWLIRLPLRYVYTLDIAPSRLRMRVSLAVCFSGQTTSHGPFARNTVVCPMSAPFNYGRKTFPKCRSVPGATYFSFCGVRRTMTCGLKLPRFGENEPL